MAKKIQGYIKLQIPAGKANPSPPVGPALGQRQLNIMEFCKAFNALTQSMEPGSPVPVVITYYADRTFSIEIKKSPVSYYIKKAAKINKGSDKTGKVDSVGEITMDQVKQIAKEKIENMNSFNLDAACQSVIGTARSMGVKVEG
ncbi:MAG: 50S ribosomal protein L11 [Pseudomonadota bacterium]